MYHISSRIFEFLCTVRSASKEFDTNVLDVDVRAVRI